MSGLSLAGSGLTLEQSSGGGSASNGFPITSGQSGVVSSGGSIIILSGGSETISGTETIASGGALIVSAGGSETISGTETIASGGTLTVNAGGTETVRGSLLIASGGSETVQSGGTFTIANGAAVSLASVALGSSGGGLQAVHSALADGYLCPGLTAGRWYGNPWAGVNSSTVTSAVSGTIYALLFYNPAPQTISNLGSYVVTSATGNLIWGVYKANPVGGGSGGTPAGATLVGATTSVSISASAAGHSAAFTPFLDQGYHWLAVMADATPTLAGMNGLVSGGLLFAGGVATLAATTTNFALGYTAAGNIFSSGMPTTFPAATAVSGGTALVGTMVQK